MFAGDVFHAVADHHVQSFIIRRQHEKLVRNCHHLRIDLHCGDACLRNRVVNKFRQRAAAQSDQVHVARLGFKQQKSHHAARVDDFQVVWSRNAHGALHGIAADMQCAHTEFFANVDRLVIVGRFAYSPALQELHRSGIFR